MNKFQLFLELMRNTHCVELTGWQILGTIFFLFLGLYGFILIMWWVFKNTILKELNIINKKIEGKK